MATSHLEVLSTELLVHVLSALLSAKEIVRARATCSRMQRVIDNASNAAAIASVLRSRRLKEIQAFLDRHVFFGKDKPVHHAVADILYFRGIWPQDHDRTADYSTIAAIWTAIQPDDFPKPDPRMMRPRPVYCVNRLIKHMVELHLQYHVPDFLHSAGPKESRDVFVRKMHAKDQMRIGSTAYFEQVYEDIVATPIPGVLQPGNFASAPLHSHALHLPTSISNGTRVAPNGPRRDLPLWPLTKVASLPPRTLIKDGACTREWCAEWLGLPLLLEDSLSYCVRSEWAYKVVEAVSREGSVLQGLVLAAVMDEIYLF